ncbi:MAG TPA: M13-type metalloendopeptidase [Arenimonas sp.]|nr:M13-type metalloendopeptidase [Arenimonas sp.]
MKLPNTLLLSLAITAALTACNKSADAPESKAVAPAYTLDVSKLPPMISFLPDDIDKSKDACNEFDTYVNGKWLAANPIPSDRSSWGPGQMLAERSLAIRHQLAEQASKNANASGIDKIVGDFWATGMDKAKIDAQGITPLKDHLAKIDAVADAASIAEYLRTSAAKGDFSLFSFGPEADFKDSTQNIAYAMQGGLGLPDKGYYFDADKKDKLDAYKTHIAKVLELSGATTEDAARQADAVIAFETRLASASKSSEELSRDVSLYYNPISLVEADKLTPNFSWTTFFKSQGLAVPEKFSLAMPAFHAEVSKMMTDMPADTWKAFLRYHLVDSASPYLSETFVQEHFAFHNQAMAGQKEQKARWKRVLGAIENNAGEAMGLLYVKVAFPPESKAKMEVLVKNLSIAFKARIEQLSWMSDETKKKALAKLATFEPRVGYPDKWRDFTNLKTSRDSYISNALAANEFNYKWALSKIGKPVDKTEWGMTPQTVNAYYNPLANQITFPAAILQPPFFDPAADEAMNYGAIGAVIGHEITHGFDDQGSRFGPTGNFENWWTPADSEGFTSRTDKLVKQFDAYEALPGLKVNGKLTLGENIADIGGLATAYDAMKIANKGKTNPMVDNLSEDQRFFLSWATAWRTKMTPEVVKVQVASDPHAPEQFRAIGAPANLPAFAAAFQCKAGDSMMRTGDQQVVIW